MSDSDRFVMDFDESRPWPFARSETPPLDPAIARIYLASALTNVNETIAFESARVRGIVCAAFEGYECDGVRFEIYDPGEITPPGSHHTADDVYITDHHHTSNADLVVFFLNAPSLGVGMEAQIAADCTLPRVVILRKGSPVSRMFRGLFSPTIVTIEYEDLSDLHTQLVAHLPIVAQYTITSARSRRWHLLGFAAEHIGIRILRQRILRGISLAELSKQSDIGESWLQRLETDSKLPATMSLIKLVRICSVLNTNVTIALSGVPSLDVSEGEDDLSPNEKSSLDNLVEFVRTRQELPSDQRILWLWRDYQVQEREEYEEAIRHRSRAAVVSIEDWRRRYEQVDDRLF